MASIPDDKVQEVRDRVDIVDLVGRYVELRRAGRNFKGLCPFHQEKSPSFNVNPERKGYKCFGCGAGGDALRFVMEIEGKSFPEAVRKLAELYGVTLPAEAGRRDGPDRSGERDEAYALLRHATELYENLLWHDERGAAGRRYLEARGIEPEIARTFRLGYAPAPSEAGWDTLVRAIGEARLDTRLAESLGLVGRSDRTGNRYDRFRGRLMFPIVQPGGEVIAFSGRIVPPHDADQGDRPPPKYVNSSESLLFTKGKTLFGLHTARPAIRTRRRAILVEGNIDVVKLHQWGHDETIAPLGTALTPEQARLIARFADEVVMCFDGDQAGKKAAWAALPHLLEADLDTKMVLLPPGEDPDSVGSQRFSAMLERAKPALEEMMIRIAARAGTATLARAKGFDRVLPLIAHVPRESAREIYADRASELFGVPRGKVGAALRAMLQAGRKPASPQEISRPFPSTSDAPVPVSAPVRSLPPLPAGQKKLTMLLVDVPHLASLAERTGALDCVTDGRLSPIVRAVVEGARSGENPGMDDLLGLVPEGARKQVYEGVFAGEFRPAAGDTVDPQVVFDEILRKCRKEALDSKIKELDRQGEAAVDAELARELYMKKLELQRQLDAHEPTAGEPSPQSPSGDPVARN